MGFAANLKNITGKMQQGAKGASITLTQRALRVFSGLFLGVVLSLIIQEFAQSGAFMFVFFSTLFAVLVYKLLHPLTLFQVFIFDVICILIATLLRMYIMIAP